MPRMYPGRKPAENDGWEMLCSTKCKLGIIWLVYAKPQEHDDEWRTYKIVANGKAPDKANYWLARRDTTGQLGFPRDYAMLRATRPEVHDFVERLFQRVTKERTQ